MKTKEKEDEIELKRLRTESRLLRQRCDMLEQESCNLADRLIQGQVTLIIILKSNYFHKIKLLSISKYPFHLVKDFPSNFLNRLLEQKLRKIRLLSKGN